MSKSFAGELADTINTMARDTSRVTVEELGFSERTARHASRLILRNQTPYPYRIREVDSVLPDGKNPLGRLVRCSREEGLKEIHSTVDTHDKEHAWLFVNGDEEFWLDVTTAGFHNVVMYDEQVHQHLANIFPDVEHVHTHPSYVGPEVLAAEPDLLEGNHLARFAIPSDTDLRGHRSMSMAHSDPTRPVSRIVSHYGVTSYTSVPSEQNSWPKLYDLEFPVIDKLVDPVQGIHKAFAELSAQACYDDGTQAFLFQFDTI